MQYSTFRGRGPLLAASVLFAAGALGAVVSMTSSGLRRRAQLRRWMTRCNAALPARGNSKSEIRLQSKFGSLRKLLRGCDMTQVTRYLGEPRTRMLGAAAPANAVWYYPMDARRQVALAVTFVGGAVDHIEWLAGPDGDD